MRDLGQSQGEFIARVKAALHDRGAPVALPDDLEIARVIDRGSDRLSVYMERVEQAKMHAYRAGDERAMIDTVMRIIESVGGKSAIVPDEDIPHRDALIARLKAAGIALLDVDDNDASFVADVGITAVSCAIAETGSM